MSNLNEITSVPTLMHARQRHARIKRETYVPLEHGSLNEKFGIAESEIQPAGYPDLGYLHIGVNGTGHVADGSGTSLPIRYAHYADHASLFRAIPFVMRPVANDLSPAERSRYRLRVKQTYNSIEYWCYYLLKIDFEAGLPSIFARDTDGNETAFTPSAAMQNPARVHSPTDQAAPLSENVLITESYFDISLDSTDISNLRDVGDIILGQENFTIDEIGVVSAYDVAGFTNEGASYTEVVTAEIMYHMETLSPVGPTTPDINWKLAIHDISDYA